MSKYEDFELDITSPTTNDSVDPRASGICLVSLAICQISINVCEILSLDWCTMLASCDGTCTGDCTVSCGPQCTNTCGCTG